METFAARMDRYIAEYSAAVWPTHEVPKHKDEWDLAVTEIRADGFANAHVEGEHGTEDMPCPYATADECGERAAAAEFVETR